MEKHIRFIILTSFLLCIFLAGAAITNAIDIREIPASFLGAALGAVITAVVTMLLLKGQTDAEEVKERNVRVFGLKKKAFSKYIDMVWDIWADQKIDDREFEELYSHFYKSITMYLKDDGVRNKFAEHLIEIGKCIGESQDDQKEIEKIKIIKSNVFNIINILIKDLSLGGKVDEKKHKELEQVLFPGFFKKAIVSQIDTELKVYSDLLPGHYETLWDGREWLCYNFKTLDSLCKIIIGPFHGNDGKITAGLYIEIYVDQRFPRIIHYRNAKSGFRRRKITLKIGELSSEWFAVYKPLPKDENNPNDVDNDENNQEYILDFDKPQELQKKYGENYHSIAGILAGRVGRFIKTVKVMERDEDGNETGKELSIFEFMKQERLLEKKAD